MIEVEDVKNWLRDGEDFDAASLMEQCEFSYEFIDLAFPLDGGDRDIELYTLKIHVPRKILKDLPKYKIEIDKIEAAVKELNAADSGFYIQNIYWVALRGKTESSPSDAENQKIKATYEVVLSFAGEDREYVERVAECLKKNNVKVFYDKYEEVTLWGKDLSEHLDKIYRGNARYCVMFLSKNYANKVWTRHERRSALAKAITEKGDYILPTRFDDTEIPGIQPTIGYVDLSKKTTEELCKMILQKLGRII